MKKRDGHQLKQQTHMQNNHKNTKEQRFTDRKRKREEAENHTKGGF